MENYSIVLFILFIMITVSALSERMKLPYPILLIIMGMAVGFIPAIPDVELSPDIVFLLFLPPLLYDAAFNISYKSFRTHFNTITTLAVSLVFLTAAAIAAVAHFFIPGMTWPLAFVLGSILSATDAVAAISITKGLGLSHKTNTILEGESLVNDASALVSYQFAVAAVSGTAFVLWKATVQFVIMMAGGFLIGVVMGKMLQFILKRVHENHMVAISFMLLTPFVTYQVAEEMHVSGILAVVVQGLLIARLSNAAFGDQLKQEMRSVWDIIIFLLNGLIFIFIGMQLPYVIKKIDPGQVWLYVGYAFIITVVALLVRLSRVYLQKINLDRAFRYGRGRIKEGALLDFKNSFIISWSGMRGIVSLATAIGLPVTLGNGHPFPERDVIVFLSINVVLFTLIGQGITLPWLVRKLKDK